MVNRLTGDLFYEFLNLYPDMLSYVWIMSNGSIFQLSDDTINKIAAGEVIDRPASAVKELIENSLDAGASRIQVHIEDGGKELIRVTDNGCGMIPDDVDWAWKRHATSKLKTAEELFKVGTFGFRGEALASVASISELTIETRSEIQSTGVCLTVSEDKQLERREIAREAGTTISVKNLFRNSPVRRRFLATARSESSRIVQIMTKLGLANPEVAFQLTHGNRTLLAWNSTGLRQRVNDVFGAGAAEELLPVDWTDSKIHVHGFISQPHQTRARASHQFVYVNKRVVQSPLISRGWADGYDVLPPGRQPLGVLFFTIPLEEVDINIHPAKREVKFLNRAHVFWAVKQSIRMAFRKAVQAPELDLGSPEKSSKKPEAGDEKLFVFRMDDEVGESKDKLEGQKPNSSPQSQLKLFPGASDSSNPGQDFQQLNQSKNEALRERLPEWRSDAWPPHLQLHNRFLVFGVESGMVLINQHAAHERILFEKAQTDLQKRGGLPAQQLLFPEVLEFSPQEAMFLEENVSFFRALGFDLEAFGGNTFQLRGVPAELQQPKAVGVIREMLQDILDGPKKSDENILIDILAKAFSKSAAVKSGEPLETAKASALIDSLFATRNPYVSPSGAPIVVKYDLAEIERKFGIR